MLVRFRPRKDITIWELARTLQLYFEPTSEENKE